MRKKFTLKPLMLASLIMANPLLFASEDQLLSYQNNQEILAERYHNFFHGSTRFCPKELQQTLLSTFETDHKHPILTPEQTPHHEALRPYAENVKQYLRTLDFEGRDALLGELETSETTASLSPSFFLNFLFRLQGIQSSNVSDYEKEFSDHFYPLNLILRRVTENEGWRTPLPSIFEMMEQNTQSYPYSLHFSELGISDTYFTPRSSEQTIYTKLADDLDKALPHDYLLPVVGAGYFGFHYLIDHLIHHRYPIAFPNAKQKLAAHSTKMVPSAFSFHELVHLFLDQRKTFLQNYAKKLFDKLQNNEAAIPHIITHVVELDQLMTFGLESLLAEIDASAAKGEMSEIQYKKTLHGFFLILHETPKALEKMIEFPKLSDFLASIEQKLFPDDVPDIFRTSPLDGSCSFSDEEIRGLAPSSLDLLNQFHIGIHQLKKPFMHEQGIKNIDIKRSEYSIDISIALGNDQSFFYSVETLAYHHKNALHMAKALRLVDPTYLIDSNITSLPDTEQQREAAIKEITQIHQDTNEHIREFIMQSRRILSMRECLLDETYRQKFQESKTKFNATKEFFCPCSIS